MVWTHLGLSKPSQAKAISGAAILPISWGICGRLVELQKHAECRLAASGYFRCASTTCGNVKPKYQDNALHRRCDLHSGRTVRSSLPALVLVFWCSKLAACRYPAFAIASCRRAVVSRPHLGRDNRPRRPCLVVLRSCSSPPRACQETSLERIPWTRGRQF